MPRQKKRATRETDARLRGEACLQQYKHQAAAKKKHFQ
jgi:hypothetical protein